MAIINWLVHYKGNYECNQICKLLPWPHVFIVSGRLHIAKYIFYLMLIKIMVLIADCYFMRLVCIKITKHWTLKLSQFCYIVSWTQLLFSCYLFNQIIECTKYFWLMCIKKKPLKCLQNILNEVYILIVSSNIENWFEKAVRKDKIKWVATRVIK